MYHREKTGNVCFTPGLQRPFQLWKLPKVIQWM